MSQKVSFGFSKIVKKPQLLPTNNAKAIEPEDKIEIIECLEGQTIKIAGGVQESKEGPLVIPLQTNTTPLEKVKKLHEMVCAEPLPNNASSETLDQRAAREIVEGLTEAHDNEEAQRKFTVALTADNIPLDGAVTSTMDDYEAVPIQKFGLAMLRGMGWKDEEHVAKQRKLEDDLIVCRPKGLGLGADKAMKQQVKDAVNSGDKNGDKLQMKKGAFVRVIAGKHKDLYGQVEGMDEESGRTFIKFALGGNRESINEAFVLLVTEKDYKENRKVLNVSKYEEYKSKQEHQEMEKIERESKYHRDDKRGLERHQKRGNTSSEDDDRQTNRKNNNDSEYKYKHQGQDINGRKRREEGRHHRGDKNEEDRCERRTDKRDQRRGHDDRNRDDSTTVSRHSSKHKKSHKSDRRDRR